MQAKRGKGVSSSLNWFGQFTDGESGRPAPPAAQRKRSLFLDTMQFMPQVRPCTHLPRPFLQC